MYVIFETKVPRRTPCKDKKEGGYFFQNKKNIWKIQLKLSNSTPTKLQTRITFDLIKIFAWFFIPEKAQILNFLKNNIMVPKNATKTTLYQNVRFGRCD